MQTNWIESASAEFGRPRVAASTSDVAAFSFGRCPMSRDVDHIAKRQYKRLSRPLAPEVRESAEDQAAKIEQVVNLFRRSPNRLWCEAAPSNGIPVLVNPATWIAEGECYRAATELERHSLEITFNLPNQSIDFRGPDYLARTADAFRDMAEQLLSAAQRLDAACLADRKVQP
jgi:hypothetical protein